MLMDTGVFDSFISWCKKNDMIIKPTRTGFKIKFFQISFNITKNGEKYEIDENSSIWQNYRSRYFIPGIRVNKNKVEKLCKNFKWDEYKSARLFFNKHSNTWGLYGVCMKDREIIFRKICSLGKNALINAFGTDWEEKYWEEIYQ